MNITALLAAFSLVAIAPSFATEIPTDFSEREKPATIKVLLHKNCDTVLLEARGPYEICNPLSHILLSQGAGSKRDWVTPSQNGLIWGELVPGNFQLRLVPKDAKSTLLVNGIEYRGCVEIYDCKGKLAVVNEVDVERYLKSILTSFSQDLDEEVMDSLAVVARTNAYYITHKNPVTQWHVDAEEVGYQGHAITLQNLPADRAIDNTRHMVLSYHGVPFPATWTKDSAGKTADFSAIFRKSASCPPGVDAPFAAHERISHAWNFSIPKQALAKAIGASQIQGIDLYQDPTSHKVYAVRIHDEKGTQQIDFLKLQQTLSATKLKSNDFTVQIKGQEVLFQGFGEGVGTGLCLLSASAMADKGEKAPKILETFFPETQLDRKRSLQ